MYAKNKQRPKFRQKPQRLKFFTFLLSPFTIIIVQGYFSTTSLSYLPLLYNIPFLSSSSLRHPLLTFLFFKTSLSYLPLPYDTPFLPSSSLKHPFLIFLFPTTSLSYLPLLYDIPFLPSSSLRHPFLSFLFSPTSVFNSLCLSLFLPAHISTAC